MNKQLTFDGREVPAELVLRPVRHRLSETQQSVLRLLREQGTVTPREAGLLLYETQRTPWRKPYASTDGSEVLRRLALAGLVHRESRGRWVAGPGPRPELRRSEVERGRR